MKKNNKRVKFYLKIILTDIVFSNLEAVDFNGLCSEEAICSSMDKPTFSPSSIVINKIAVFTLLNTLPARKKYNKILIISVILYL